MSPSNVARRRLSRDRVLAAAVALADAEGLDALTMRALGERLGVEAMSLYNHVRNKDDLLAGMVERITATIPYPTTTDPWRPALHEVLSALHERYVTHAWACNVLVARSIEPGPARLRLMDWVLGCLRGAGFSVEQTHHAFHVLDVYVLGYATQEVSFPVGSQDIGALATEYLATFPHETYPHLAEHIAYHAEEGVLGEGDFEHGLDLILDSLERRLSA